MKNFGQNGGKEDADIDAELAWNITTGTPETIVAVIDTGVRITHNDLSKNMLQNDLASKTIQACGGKGLTWMKVLDNDQFESNIVQFFSQEQLIAAPDCGLGHLTKEMAMSKLKVMSSAVKKFN